MLTTMTSWYPFRVALGNIKWHHLTFDIFSSHQIRHIWDWKTVAKTCELCEIIGEIDHSVIQKEAHKQKLSRFNNISFYITISWVLSNQHPTTTTFQLRRDMNLRRQWRCCLSQKMNLWEILDPTLRLRQASVPQCQEAFPTNLTSRLSEHQPACRYQTIRNRTTRLILCHGVTLLTLPTTAKRNHWILLSFARPRYGICTAQAMTSYASG